MSWQTVKLGDTCEVKRGTTITEKQAQAGDVPVVAGGLTYSYTHNEANREGNVITVSGSGANAGYVNFWRQPIFASDCSTIQSFSGSVDIKFVFYFLKSKQQYINSTLRSGAAQPHVYAKDIAQMMIPLPPLAQQQRIAAILDKAAEIKAKREIAIAKLDELAQSTFVEMFGDLALNELNWDTKTLKEISITKGQYGGGFSAAEFQPNSPRYVRITDITEEGELKPDAVSADGDANDFENYYLADGDLLFARSGATVGKAYLHKSKLPHIYAGYLIRFVIDLRQALPEYVYAVTRTQYYKNWVLSKQNVVAQPNINAQQYGDLKIPVPPLSLQIEYAQFRDALLKQKRNYETTTETLSSLIASLQHQAFTTGFAA